MGRKNNSSDGGGGGASGGGPATVMGLRMIQCGRQQTVHVIQPDGQVRQFPVPVQVSDLLHLYPHYYVSHATTSAAAPSGGAAVPRRNSAILPMDAHLETGSIYALLPLPRLFPTDPPSSPHFCACFFDGGGRPDDYATGLGGAIKAEILRHWPGSASSSKISPDDGAGVSAAAATQPIPRRLWEPELDIIPEDRVLVSAATEKDEVAAGAGRKESQNKGKKLASAINSLRLRWAGEGVGPWSGPQ